MNRIEIIGLFTAMKRLLTSKDYDGALDVVTKVLTEAERKPTREEKERDDC